MLRNAFIQLRASAGRVLAAALAIVLGVGFVSATLVFTGTLQSSVEHATAAPELAADVVVTSGEGVGQPEADRISNVDGVEAAELRYFDTVESSWSGGSGYSSAFVVPENPRLRWFDLAEGALPSGVNEVAVDTVAAKNAGLGIGSTITIEPIYSETPTKTDMKVTGLVDTGRTITTGGATPSLFATAQSMESLGISLEASSVDVLASGDVEATRQAIADELGAGYTVETGEQRAQQAIEQLGPVSALLNSVLLPFAGIALFVAGFVIVNTFSVLFAQRSRQYALLRCVGATRSQIRSSALMEALLVGLISSVVGTAFGIFAAATVGWPLGLTDSPVDLGSLGIPPLALLLPPVVGVIVTLLSALAPAGRATRVSPLAALRPVASVAAAKRMSTIRLVFALLFAVPGLLLVVFGGLGGSMVMALPGALLTALGCLLWTPSLIPFVARTIGRLFRLAGPTGVLAAENAVRNPYRAASTSTALMIGVGLIVLLLTGTSTAQVTANERIDEMYPVDAMLTSEAGPVPEDLARQVSEIQGTAESASLRAVDGQVSGSDFRILGLDPAEYREVVRHGEDLLAPGKALINPTMLENSSSVQNGQLTVTGPGGEVTVEVAASEMVDSSQVVMAQSDLDQLAPESELGGVWLRADDQVDTSVFVDNLQSFYSQNQGKPIELGGAAPMRAQTDTILNVLLSVVAGLLGVAVIIAVVGIANTLGLSVLERGRESALLRALGLTRGQLRGMLTFEAILLALVGAALGTGLGVLVAWSGASAMLGELDMPLTMHVPVVRLALVLGCAVVAGVLASVLPARRAAKAAPAQALSDE